jgi:glutamyl-tRNA synthetase
MIRTRFAPSPTGFLHIGGLRTAAYAYALAKHNNGQFLLRIEDTDQKREVAGAVEGIYQTLKVFNLSWDETPIIQSERAKAGVYHQAAQKLLGSGQAFYCQCQPKNAKEQGYSESARDPCRDKNLTSGAIKLKVPAGEIISFHDFVIDKDIKWHSESVPDVVLLKSNGFPTYHLAVVVDDSHSHITHVIRAVEWLPSTPIHVLVYKYLGLSLPQIGHPTDILDPIGGKLSKRKRNVSCEQFIAEGYLPEALLNFVILLGWAPKDNRELFTLDEFVAAFDPKGFQKSNALYSDNKLNWFNGHYIRQKSDTEFTQLVKQFMKNRVTDTKLAQIIPLIKDRLVKLSDINNLLEPFINPPQNIDLGLFTPNAMPDLASIFNVMQKNDFSNTESLNTEFKKEITKLGVKTGDYYMDMRVALMGSRSTPPITESALIIGKEETLKRIKNALKSFPNSSLSYGKATS